MRRLSENLEIQVTRIDQRTYHVLHTEYYEIISSNTSSKKTTL
jgi:NADH dehydrogenase FAD-containing subunit